MSENSNKNDPPEKNIIVNSGNDSHRNENGEGSSGIGTGLGNSAGGNKGDGWTFGFGGGGSGGFSGGFGGSSRKKSKKRAKARARAIAQQRAEAEARAHSEAEARARAEAEAKALAQREQAIAAHKQLIESLVKVYSARRSELDDTYSVKTSMLTQSLEAERLAVKKAPGSPGNERWQLYLISKEKTEIEGLISRKNTELQERAIQASSFDGHDPLSRGVEDYRYSLAQYSAHIPMLANDAHKQWEDAYISAHEAKLLAESIRQLGEKLKELSAHYGEQEIKWLEIDALNEARRQHAQQREEQINYKVRVDEQLRHDRIKAANTVRISSTSMAAGALMWSRAGAAVAEELAVALEASIAASLKELGRIAAIRAGQTLSVTLSALVYSEPLGNGELTPEQRRRLFQGISLRADVLGLPHHVNLPAIASTRGSIELPNRIKAIPVQGGTELRAVSTGYGVSPSVPVVSAAFDPLSNTYQAHTSGSNPKSLVFSSLAPLPDTPHPRGSVAAPTLLTSEPQIIDVPKGVDTGINDCIVCFPAESGLAPQYLSFESRVLGSGVVTGNGQTASMDWWANVSQEQGVAIPAQIGEQVRYREFSSIAAFDKATWLAIAENPVLSEQFGEVNLKRMTRGFAPYAPKATWTGERREFEFRSSEAANDAVIFFNLDQLSITLPNSAHGVPRLTPTFLPWPASNSTWTPLVPPGSEALGPTELPLAPDQPMLYPGETTDPVETQNESLPAVDPDDVHVDIPGYGEDDDLPSPDLVFAGPPVDPLEVGPYNELSGRSRLDGLDIDHIVSRQALKKHILNKNPAIDKREMNDFLRKAPSIAIPAHIHQKFSETYGGRNTSLKQDTDASDLRVAVDSNLNAMKPGLIEAGLGEAAVEAARLELHELNVRQRWYP